MQEETLDMKQGERSMISREDNEINEKETMYYERKFCLLQSYEALFRRRFS